MRGLRHRVWPTLLLASCTWSLPTWAMRPPQLSLSLAPNVGYVWTNTAIEGSITRPGQLTLLSDDARVDALNVGASLALSCNFWSHTKQTALGPVLGVAVGRSVNGAIKAGFRDDNDAAATRVEEQLHASVTRLGGHAGLTFAMLSGRLQWRGLVGIQHLSIRVTGLDQPTTESYDTFTFALGGRLRFPARGQWLGFVGAGCGAAPTFLGVVDKSCSGEVGVEWELLR